MNGERKKYDCLILKISEIAQFTRATPGSSVLSHNFVPWKTCQSLSLYFVTNFVRKQNASNIQKLNKKSELNCMIVKIPAC